MIKKILKAIISPIYRALMCPSFRYSRDFMGFQGIFSYFAPEEMMQIAIDLVARVFKLEGDYLEFGVYEGQSFVSAFHFAQSRNLKSMKFYAFDSFEGLPKIKGVDSDGFCSYHKGQYACDVNKFKKIISSKGVDLNKVKIIPGWYNEVLNEETKKKLPIRKASIIWIDCDL